MVIKIRSPIVLEKEPKIDPRVKDILLLLAAGSVLAAFIVLPGLPLAFKGLYKRRWQEENKGDWGRFNFWRLRSELRRLKKQKDVKIVVENGQPVVKLTEKGKLKVLRYNLENVQLSTQGSSDKRWRLIIYDIPKEKKLAREAFRSMLKRLKLYQLQKSVYLTPFPCEDEIKFIREFFGVGEDVQILTVEGLENEEIYRKYFGI